MYGTNPSNRLTISNCYASGNVQGTSIVGSFSGRFNRVIVDNCYSLGSVTSIESSVGAFTSSAFSTTCTNSFWNSTTAGVATSPIAIGKTTEELRTLATFIDSDWDFVDESANGENDYWTLNSEINDGFPYLTNLEDAFNESIEVPHVILNILPTDGQWNEATDVSLSWDAIPQLVGFTRGYDVRVTIQVETEIDTIIGNVENEESRVVFSFTDLPGGELPYSATVRWTVTPYYKINNVKSYPTTEPQEYMFATNVEIQPEIPSESNPIAGISINIPDNATPHVPVILENLPTEGFAYQPIAAFTYNFDITGIYNIQVIYPELAEISHVYIGETELDPFDPSLEEDFWVIFGGTLFIIYNYDGSKGDKDIVITNNDDFTLPVELSSFNAIATADNFAQISWETASESNLLGYNIYRNERENSETSQRVNTNIISANNYASGSKYSFVDSEIETETTYYYWLESVELSNENKLYGPVSVRIESELNNNVLPTATSLFAAYPNPFNPETTINFNVKENDLASLVIYNLKGQVVKSYTNFLPGQHSLVWNAKDDNNKNVASGVYLYKLISNSYNKTNKMILMK